VARALPGGVCNVRGDVMDLALFDFDGTITERDTFLPFIRFAVRRPRVVLGTVLLSPMILGYELAWVPATRMRAAVTFVAFRGRPERELNELGARYAQGLRRHMRREALDKVAWHKAKGDHVVIVSASLRPYLSVVSHELGVDLICTELESRAGILTGRYSEGDCTGAEKARRVRARYDLARYPVIYAYGDTSEDEPLLQLASKRYFRWQERAEPTTP
jgi:phosphatidylglycerophosphatase C